MTSHVRTMIALFLLTVSLGLGSATAQGRFQRNPNADALFADGTRLYRAGRYGDARAIFEELRKGEIVHQRTTAAYLMAAKSAFALHDYEAVGPMLLEFIQRYPGSSYLADAYYTLGMNSFVTHRYVDAGRQLLHCMELATDDRLRSASAVLFERVANDGLTSDQARELYAMARTAEAKDLLRLALAERVYAEGEPSRARIILDDTLSVPPSPAYAARYRAMRQKLSEIVSLKVGALLPLMRGAEQGATRILAEEMLEGMNVALAEYRSTKPGSTPAVSLEVRDIGRDSVAALRELAELARSSETVAVVGPIFSNVAMACAPRANEAGVPLISPTATSNGIAATGPYVFQMNPDFATRGKAMAQFAAVQLGLRRVAVLAPADGVGRELAASFVAEAHRRGIVVAAVETYPAGVGDLREQVMRLRRAGVTAARQLSLSGKVLEGDLRRLLEAGARRDLLDSVRAKGGMIAARELFGTDRGGAIAESIKTPFLVPAENPENVDAPIGAIEGLYIPVNDAEEMGAIAPQLTFFNLRTQLLGSNEWYDLDQLAEHRRYVNGVMFASDTYVSSEDPAYAAFDAAYVSAMGKRPSKYSLFGYDAMKLLLDRIAKGATGRKELAKQLALVRHFQGVHAKISLSNGRVNSDLHILQYTNGKVTEIGEITVE